MTDPAVLQKALQRTIGELGCYLDHTNTPMWMGLRIISDRSYRVVVRYRARPVELMREGDGVTARSLVCTHVGCVVQWDPSENCYVCPCHRGRFDENGQVVDGPPTRPLAEIATKVSGTHVVLGG